MTFGVVFPHFEIGTEATVIREFEWATNGFASTLSSPTKEVLGSNFGQALGLATSCGFQRSGVHGTGATPAVKKRRR